MSRFPLRLALLHCAGLGFLPALVGLFAAPLLADEPNREIRLSLTSPDAEANFTWRRDRPYGELGFPGDQFGPHWEFLRLATHTPVQEELDLTPEQIAQLQPVLKGLMAAQGAWSQGLRNPDYLSKEYAQARRVLTEEQAHRIEQIKLQRRGVQALLHADVQETLDMDARQIETIQTGWREHVAKAEKGWKGDEGRRSYHQVWKLALKTLSDSQRRKLYEMTGPLVDLPPPRAVESDYPE